MRIILGRATARRELIPKHREARTHVRGFGPGVERRAVGREHRFRPRAVRRARRFQFLEDKGSDLMCVYCMGGDYVFRHDPPWNPPYKSPLIPMPINPNPVIPWSLPKLVEFADLLRRIKDLEDQLGCPCEPNKADYLTILKDRIVELERKAAENGR